MKILVVDDHNIFRVSLIGVLKSIYTTYDFEEAGNGSEALEKLKSSKVDLVFLDVSMPIMNGYEVCKFIRQNYPTLPIIMLTQFYNNGFIYHFFKMGVQSFLTKEASVSELTSAIDCALRGEFFFPEQIRIIIEDGRSQETTGRFELNQQEKRLIQLLHKGITSKDIAHQMGLTIKTVHTYRERLLKKTNSANCAELISFGFRTGILMI
jgi:DNA-binding NarL/FixJ family response regulator